jgi:superfamily II DNA or RNA helicase/diadenosine tetraphosphate (Ap4A) HIT family hydrolase
MSIFLEVPPAAWVASNHLAFAVRDRFPVSPGHTLVITRRVVTDWFAASRDEQHAVLELVGVVKEQLEQALRPDGFNVGFNAGQAAGQTVMHLHVHVIPRFRGDVEDPRGGVRYVIPANGNYCRRRDDPLTDGEGTNNLYRALVPLLPRAHTVDILAAFVQDSGLDLLEPPLLATLARGARLRLLTGDYLDITQARALRRLLEWAAAADAMVDEDDADAGGVLAVRIVETAHLKRAFHPKSWRVVGEGFGVAWVGSSNLSRSALLQGVEWNLRVDRHLDPAAWDRTVTSFDRLWGQAVPLSEAWVNAYEQRVVADPHRVLTGEVQLDTVEPPPVPNALQLAALTSLAQSRRDGRQRALVVMATGLGKTLVAALDINAFRAEYGRPPRVLVVAHRHELLAQVQQTLRRTWPEARFGWFSGRAVSTNAADVLLASIQKLARRDQLRAFDPKAFDYLLVDEVHHADAPSYRRVLGHLEPSFLLGLTATPERADAGDVIGMFDDHVAYRADLGEGITEKLLVPFRYFGLADPTDYTPIPWRNGRFEPCALAAAVQTQVRMERLWEAWTEADKAGGRTLVFCASTAHADFVSDWLSARHVRSVAVHSAAHSADRAAALADLEEGRLDAICSVDLFNEGIDCKPIDRVVMLRPTESPVVFLQQLGRGLRTADGKLDLVVIDFVGNHRVFLDRVRTLLSLVPTPMHLEQFLACRTTSSSVAARFLGGCSVNLDLVAIDLLQRLMPQGDANEAVRVYRQLKGARGQRPSLGELVRMGLPPALARKRARSWFDFVAGEGDLEADESMVLERSGDWLRDLEVTPMTKCFKMVVLEVMLAADALLAGMDLGVLADRCHAYLVRSPELMRDLNGVRELPDPTRPIPEVWRRYWKGAAGPIAAWTLRNRPEKEKAWFRVDGKRLVPRIPAPQNAEAVLVRMTRELVDARLAQYRRRPVAGADVGVRLRPRGQVVAFPMVRAVAGHAAGAGGGDRSERRQVALPLPEVEVEGLFALRAVEASADGDNGPIHTGDWLLMWPSPLAGGTDAAEPSRLPSVADGTDGQGYLRPAADGHRQEAQLQADRPDYQVRPATGSVPGPVLVGVVRPEELGPPAGTALAVTDVAGAFALSAAPRGEWSRVDGHLFLMLSHLEQSGAAGRASVRVPDRWLGETAFILVGDDSAGWVYVGVGHWHDDHGAWVLPALPPHELMK